MFNLPKILVARHRPTLEVLQREHPSKYQDEQLRTFQRRVKPWWALKGPGNETFFPQVCYPGEWCKSDFTSMDSLGATINGIPFDHMLCQFVLWYSNWEGGTVCFSGSYESLSAGLQNALWKLGWVLKYHRTDNLTGTVNPVEKAEVFVEYSNRPKQEVFLCRRIRGYQNLHLTAERVHYLCGVQEYQIMTANGKSRMKENTPNFMNRREMIKSVALGTGALCFAPLSGCATGKSARARVPPYLSGYEQTYARDPHQAARDWFHNARFGLFLHYGLYSLAGGEWRGKPVTVAGNPDRPVAEWIQFHGRIPLAEYAKLKDQFTAEKFDADFITDLALAANMKYINLTTRHHDSFCLFRTKQTDFNSVNSPARRDLVGELAAACHKKKIGLFLYYSHGRDWKHPHAPTPDWAANARPRYDQPQPEYVPYDQVDVGRYADFMERQITELLTQYGCIAGIWLDGEGVLKSYGKKHPGGLAEAMRLLKVDQLYAAIRRLQPQCLVSYKQGVTGTEDFITPERESFGLEKLGKQLEINTTLQVHSWGYRKADDGHHLTPDDVMALLKEAARIRANLLVNTGPLPDGSIHPEDVRTLRAVGQNIKRDGFPV